MQEEQVCHCGELMKDHSVHTHPGYSAIEMEQESKFCPIETENKLATIIEWLYVHDGGYPDKLKWREDFIEMLKKII